MKKVLYILAPNDRFNYGDLLFSKIITRYLEDVVDEIILCSTSNADLRILGGDKVNEYSVLYEADPANMNILIVAGGECLFADWFTILSYVYPELNGRIKKISRIFPHSIIEYAIRPILNSMVVRKYKPRTRFPFTIGKNELSSFYRIIYNSLGASWLQKKPSILRKSQNRAIINSVDYISVRDTVTQKAMGDAGFNVSVMPDCAILMSEYFDEDFLLSHVSAGLPDLVEHENYIFFQVNQGVEARHHDELVSLAKELYKNEKKRLCLCPIGTALGHNDDIALENIAKNLSLDSFFFIKNPAVWDIMWLIKNAYLYVGTSLHGAITAMSYETPFVGHSVQKLKSYIDKWVEYPECHYGCISELSSIVPKSLVSFYSAKEQKDIMFRSFKNIKSLI